MSEPQPTETLPACSPPPEPAYRRLTYQQMRIARDLSREGKSQVQIAEVLGCTQQTVSRALQAIAEDSTDLAIDAAKASAFRRARRLASWSETRDKIGLDAAKHLDNIAGLGEKSNQINNIAIVLGVGAGVPGQPVLEAKVVSSPIEAFASSQE